MRRRLLEPAEERREAKEEGGRDNIVSLVVQDEDDGTTTRQGNFCWQHRRRLSSLCAVNHRSIRTRRRRIIGCMAVLFLILLVFSVTIPLTVGEYAWVRRRCWRYRLLAAAAAIILPMTSTSSLVLKQKIECWEAKYHEKSELEPRFGKDQQPMNKRIYHPVAVAVPVPVDIVHYTITSRLDEPVWSLWECSMEATRRFCPTCQVHIWLVSPDQDENSQVLESILLLNNNNTHHVPPTWCIHVPHNQTMIGDLSLCQAPYSAAASNTSSTTTPTLAQRLQAWLLEPSNAHRTLPAHLSDGWRIVTLPEYGNIINDNSSSNRRSRSSLYLDADVVPISQRLFSSLPENFIPMQNSVGSYKLNGGVLRIDSSSKLFLQALANDYLEWAPQLAQHVPLKQQTFGFLGPAALTRTFLDLKDKSNVMILPPHWVEPSTNNMDLCQQSSSVRSGSSGDSSVAIHWRGKERKRNWIKVTSENACLKEVMHAACPSVLGKYQ